MSKVRLVFVLCGLALGACASEPREPIEAVPAKAESPEMLLDQAEADIAVRRFQLAQQRLVRLLEDFQTPLLSAWAIHRTELRGVARVRALIAALRERTAQDAAA